jgi:hypothetical protein
VCEALLEEADLAELVLQQRLVLLHLRATKKGA